MSCCLCVSPKKTTIITTTTTTTNISRLSYDFDITIDLLWLLVVEARECKKSIVSFALRHIDRRREKVADQLVLGRRLIQRQQNKELNEAKKKR